MYATLLTDSGHLVKRIVLAPFTVNPDVLIFGTRIFAYVNDVYVNIEKPDDGVISRLRSHVYKEIFSVAIVPNQQEWEPYNG